MGTNFNYAGGEHRNTHAAEQQQTAERPISIMYKYLLILWYLLPLGTTSTYHTKKLREEERAFFVVGKEVVDILLPTFLLSAVRYFHAIQEESQGEAERS